MGKIVVSQFLSLDGVIETPEAWHFRYLTPDMQAFTNADIHESEAMLLGRLTYEAFAPFWPTQTNNEFGIADKLNSTRKYVVSTTMQKADWNNSSIISENVIETITKLKQEIPGSIGVTGSGTLVQSLMQADLIDEYRLLIHPIIVGKGKRLFKDGIDTTSLKLVECKTFTAGVIAAVYQIECQA